MTPQSATRRQRARLGFIASLCLLPITGYLVYPRELGPATTADPECMSRLDAIHRLCGSSLCTIPEMTWRNFAHNEQELVFPMVRRTTPSRGVDECANLYSQDAETALDAPAWPPPKAPPHCMLREYTLGFAVPWRTEYHQQHYGGQAARVPNWSQNYVSGIMTEAVSGSFSGGYGPVVTKFVHQAIRRTGVRGLEVLVVGSETPWLESLLLHEGAAHVTTLEYGSIRTDHPQLSTILPEDFNQAYRSGALQRKFDLVVSYSSLEHSGLGRYGDSLNPWGDVMTVAKLHCVVQDNGKMLLGLPSAMRDSLTWNAHRIYGPARWPLILTNWEAEWFEMMDYPFLWFLENDAYRHGIVLAHKVNSNT